MTLWRLARTPRWLGYLAVAIVVAVVCCCLGVWQLHRRAEAQAATQLVADNWDREPAPLGTVLVTPDAYDEGQRWTPVTLTGEYLVDEQLLARNRPRAGQPGFEVVVPFRLDDGRIFVIDRGWLPVGSAQDSPDTVPAPPEGTVTVTVRLTGGEPVLAGRSAPEGQLATINLPQIDELVEGEVYTGAYGLLAEETPAAAERPAPVIRPEPDEGPHLSYALQWFVFATFGFGGWAYGLRQELRARNADDDEEIERESRRRARRERRAPSDADIEDALLDASDEVAVNR